MAALELKTYDSAQAFHGFSFPDWIIRPILLAFWRGILEIVRRTVRAELDEILGPSNRDDTEKPPGGSKFNMRKPPPEMLAEVTSFAETFIKKLPRNLSLLRGYGSQPHIAGLTPVWKLDLSFKQHANFKGTSYNVIWDSVDSWWNKYPGSPSRSELQLTLAPMLPFAHASTAEDVKEEFGESITGVLTVRRLLWIIWGSFQKTMDGESLLVRMYDLVFDDMEEKMRLELKNEEPGRLRRNARTFGFYVELDAYYQLPAGTMKKCEQALRIVFEVSVFRKQLRVVVDKYDHDKYVRWLMERLEERKVRLGVGAKLMADMTWGEKSDAKKRVVAQIPSSAHVAESEIWG